MSQINPSQHDIDIVDAIDTSRIASQRLAKIVSEAVNMPLVEEAAQLSSNLLQFASKLERELVQCYEYRKPLLEIDDKPVVPETPKRLVELKCEAPEKLKIPQDIIRLIIADEFEMSRQEQNVLDLKPWAFIKVMHKENKKIVFRFLGSDNPMQKVQKGFTSSVFDFVKPGQCYAVHSWFTGKFGSWDAALECGDEFETEKAAKKLAKLFRKG